MQKYDHRKIEPKWRKRWEKDSLYKTPDKAKSPAAAKAKAGTKDNYYLLVEFPYPSGNLHVGHWYAFAVPDILARFRRMQGKNVLYPIGFDAFGLPAENAAIKNKLNPRKWTLGNIEYMKKQIRSMGTSFDWSREVVTCDPAYYKWTQWLFLQLFKAGLVYRKETAVNWCPKDKTVLANEQVIDGKCERDGTEVEQRQMLQWNIKITDYAERLIKDLDALDWPKEIKESQKNWIGRSEGAEIDFPLTGAVKDDSRFLLLHGRESSSKGGYQPWLKAELEKRGYEVEVVDMPNPGEPNDEEQADYVEKNCTLDERTVIVGHSFGGVVALRLLERGHKVRRVVFAATAVSGKFLDGKIRKSVTEACKKGFDFEKIKKQAHTFMVVPDLTDKIVPIRDAETLAKNLNAMYIPGKGNSPHFGDVQEPDLLMMCAPTIRVFTTRADTLYGGTYLVLAPEHPWVTLALDAKHDILKNKSLVGAYVALAKKKTEIERQTVEKEKSGVRLEGVEAINPATGKEIPVYVADYVLGHYGTGAVMGVPAHDERDNQFAKKYKLPIVEVVEPLTFRKSGVDAFRPDEPFDYRKAVIAIVKHWSEDKYLCLTSKPRDLNYFVCGGIDEGEDPIAAGKREIEEETGYVDAQFVRQLGGTIHSRFFQSLKKYNRQADFIPLLFTLKDDTQNVVSEHEKAMHDVVWVDADKVANFINRDDVAIAWKRVGGVDLYDGEGILVNSNGFDGQTSEEARKAITEKLGQVKTTYKLRDWIVSRQRYWGVPIPIVHCPSCGPVAVKDSELPVKLPEVKDYLPEGSGKSPLAKAKKWVQVKCPKCKGKAERETDTLDTFVDSSWYYLAYCVPEILKSQAPNSKQFLSPKIQNKFKNWMPVDLYSGGAEHTTMHLLYSRFWHKALFDLGLVREPEPYTRRMNRSLILGPDGQKMSKSRGNVIDPDEVVGRLGADTVRMYLAFIGPYNEVSSFPWNPDSVVGVRRFLERVARFAECVSDEDVPELEPILHRTIKKVGDDIGALKFNTAISQLMIFLNHAEKQKKASRTQWDGFIKLLAPFAPFLAEELWYDVGHKKSSVHNAQWPSYNASRLEEATITIAVQVNGKTRGQAEVAPGSDSITQEAAATKAVQDRLHGKKIVRTIVVPGRLVNFVIQE